MATKREAQREGPGGPGAEGTEAQGPPGPRRGRPGRRSAEDRTEAVLELFAGKASVDQVAARFGVRPDTVEGWRKDALEALEAAMRRGTGKTAREMELEKKLGHLEKAFTELAIKHELVDRAMRERPFRPGRSR